MADAVAGAVWERAKGASECKAKHRADLRASQQGMAEVAEEFQKYMTFALME
jgi:hypothetical protein